MNEIRKSRLHALSLFNERARKIANSRFLAWLKTHGNKQPDMSRLLRGDWFAYQNLNSEDVDSFCLNLRLLIQDRDGFSIRCLAEIYQQFPEDYDEAKVLFSKARQELNDYLGKTAIVQLERHTPLTHKDLLDIILYGGIAHNDPKYYSEFVRMTRAGVFSSFVFATFWNIVLSLNECIQKLAILNREVIKWELDSVHVVEPKETG